MSITQERLKKLLTYNPCTGHFQWKSSRQGIRFWKHAGCHDSYNGYRRITIDGKSYMASRLAWIYIYGEEPQVVDHIDRARWNDSIWNLANGTTADNMKNSSNYIDGIAVPRNSRRQRGGNRNWNHLKEVILKCARASKTS